ncbi:MAG: hypothetical protein OIF32_04505, partial [Campylobacterales bacterium]|nr:hypothetical protein [Campylobacterales bacterium]
FDKQRYYHFFVDNNISQIICTGEYEDFVNEIYFDGKSVYDDNQEKIYSTTSYFGSSTVFKGIKSKEKVDFYVNDDFIDKEKKFLRSSIVSCIDSYIHKVKEDRLNKLLEKPLVEELYKAEENNDANFTIDDYQKLGIEKVSPLNLDSKLAQKINEVINSDQASALDVRDDPRNLQKIVTNLAILKKRDLTKYTVVELGVEYDLKQMKDLGITENLINRFLMKSRKVDSSLSLRRFLSSLIKLDKSLDNNIYILTNSDYLSLGLDVDKGISQGINDTLKKSPYSKAKVRREPIFLHSIVDIFQRSKIGKITNEDLNVLNVKLPIGIDKSKFLKGLNSVLAIRKNVTSPIEIQSVINSLERFNQADRKRDGRSLTIFDYGTLGVDIASVNKRELAIFINDKELIVNQPEKLYKYSLFLKNIFLGKLTKEDLINLELEEFQEILPCINYSLKLRSLEKMRKKEVEKLAKVIKNLRENRSFQITNRTLKILGIKKLNGKQFAKNRDRKLIGFINQWKKDKKLSKNCVEHLHKYTVSLEKLHEKESFNKGDLALEDLKNLEVISFDSNVSKKFIQAVNEVIKIDYSYTIEIRDGTKELDQIVKFLQTLNGDFKYAQLRKIGLPRVFYSDEKDLKVLFDNYKEVFYSPLTLEVYIDLIDDFYKKEKRKNINFSLSKYQKLLNKKITKQLAEGLNDFINSSKKRVLFKDLMRAADGIDKLSQGEISEKEFLFLGGAREILKNKFFDSLLKILKKKDKKVYKISKVNKIAHSLEKFYSVSSDKNTHILSIEDMNNLNLVKRERFKHVYTKGFLNYFFSSNKDLDNSYNSINAVAFYDDGKCTPEIIKSVGFLKNKSLSGKVFCQNYKEFFHRKNQKELEKIIEVFENIIGNNVTFEDLKFLGFKVNLKKEKENIVIDDLNNRIKEKQSQLKKIQLVKSSISGKDCGGFIFIELMNKSLKKCYNSENLKLEDSFLEEFLLSVVDSTKPIRVREIETVIKNIRKVMNASKGLGTLDAEDLNSLKFTNVDGSSIKEEQMAVISEHLRAGGNPNAFDTLLKSIEVSFDSLR